MMISIVGCSHFGLGNNSPKEEERPTDICTSGLETFKLSDGTKKIMNRANKENAVLLNCVLHEACGFEIPNPDICFP